MSIGLDILPLLGVDVVADGFGHALSFGADTFDEVHCFHILEHAENFVKVME